MKIIRNFFLLLIFYSSSFCADLVNEFYLGITIREFNITKKNRIKRVIKDLEQKISRDCNIKMHIVFYENIDVMFNDYLSFKNINGVIVWSRDYLSRSKQLKKISKNPFLFKNSDYEYAQYYLISNKKSKIKKVADIENKVLLEYLSEDSTGLWLDYLAFKTFKKSYKQIVEKQNEAKRRSSLVLDVYFNKADFSIVRRKDYKDMLLLNPAIKKNIVIVEKSPEVFFYGLGLVHKNLSEKVTKIIATQLKDKEFYDRYKSLLKLVEINLIINTDENYLVKMENFYKKYEKMRK